MLRNLVLALALVLLPHQSFSQTVYPGVITKLMRANEKSWNTSGKRCIHATGDTAKVASEYVVPYRAPQFHTTEEDWGHVFLVVRVEEQDWILDSIPVKQSNKRGVVKTAFVALAHPVPNFDSLSVEEVSKIVQRPLTEFKRWSTDKDFWAWTHPEEALKSRLLLLDRIEEQLTWLKKFIDTSEKVIRHMPNVQSAYDTSLKKYQDMDELPEGAFRNFKPANYVSQTSDK